MNTNSCKLANLTVQEFGLFTKITFQQKTKEHWKTLLIPVVVVYLNIPTQFGLHKAMFKFEHKMTWMSLVPRK